MGYISSAATNDNVIYFTEKGLEYLFSGNIKENLTVIYFSLGDSDANYNVPQGLDIGFVPDINGQSGTCLNITAVKSIKWNLKY